MSRPTPQEIQDIRDQAKLEEAYNKSLRMTAPAPAASKDGATMETKKSRYSGYVPVTKSGAVVMDDRKATTADKARGAKQGFDLDKESMKTSYETYKKKDDPDSKEISRRMGMADEDAIARVQQANEESDYERKRESRRSQKFAKGGAASSRADGCITKGHTKGRMV